MSMSNTLMGVLSIALLAAGPYVYFVALPRVHRRLQRALRAEGVVEGFIGGGASGVPRVRYRDASGVEHEASPSFVAGEPKGTPADPVHCVGDSVGLRYDPDDPQWIWLDSMDPSRMYRLLALFCAFGGGMLLWLALA